MKGIFIFLLVALVLTSCAKDRNDQNKKALPEAKSYMVKINDIALSKEDIEKEIQDMPGVIRQSLLLDRIQFKKFLEDYANKEMLYKEALKKGIDKDEEFNRKINSFKKITAIQLMLEKELGKKIKVTDKDIQDYYQKNKDEFIIPDEIGISHILVRSEEEIKRVQERLKMGEDFARVAKEVSEDKESAKSGGAIGYFYQENVPPEFTEAVKRLKKGEVSLPIKTKFGYHIIKITDIKKGVTVDLDSIKDDVRQSITQEKRREMFERYLQDVRKTYKVEINQSEMERFLNTYGNLPGSKTR